MSDVKEPRTPRQTAQAQAIADALRRIVELFTGRDRGDEQEGTLNASFFEELLKIFAALSLEQFLLLMRPGPDDMLTIAELAVRLKTTVRTLETWRNTGVVIPIKVDKVILYYWPFVALRLAVNYQERAEGTKSGKSHHEPHEMTRKAWPQKASPTPQAAKLQPAGGKALPQPPAKLPTPKAPSPILRTPTSVPTGAARSAVATTKRP